MEELFETDEDNEPEIISALIQIVFSLVAYQHVFDFTHNDLHTHNVMYQKTNDKYLYYRLNGQLYRVPTFGRIYKIIDFGRAIYRWNGKQYCSDSFHKQGDAAYQYNFGVFYDDKKETVEPNPSFDLCRLGCSIYDAIISAEDETMDPDTWSPLQTLIHQWCRDNRGKNILYKASGKERYPYFRLYKMIARTAVDCIPREQLQNPVFDAYRMTSKLPKKAAVQDLDALPHWSVFSDKKE